jgi:hypothetical protein
MSYNPDHRNRGNGNVGGQNEGLCFGYGCLSRNHVGYVIGGIGGAGQWSGHCPRRSASRLRNQCCNQEKEEGSDADASETCVRGGPNPQQSHRQLHTPFVGEVICGLTRLRRRKRPKRELAPRVAGPFRWWSQLWTQTSRHVMERGRIKRHDRAGEPPVNPHQTSRTITCHHGSQHISRPVP